MSTEQFKQIFTSKTNQIYRKYQVVAYRLVITSLEN